MLFSSPLFILSCITTSLFLFSSLYIWKLQKRLSTFMKGKEVYHFEDMIQDTLKRIDSLEKDTKIEREALIKLSEITKKLTQTPEMIRYKALENNNSNQSFSLALLDAHGTGLCLTALHVRDRMSLYAKKITTWQSDTELTEEEKKCLQNIQEKDNFSYAK